MSDLGERIVRCFDQAGDDAALRGTRSDDMASSDQPLDLTAIRRLLEEHRRLIRDRVAGLAKRPERGTAQGFGKRIGDGTTEAVGRLTEIGVGRSLESTLARTERALAKLDAGTYGTCDACDGPIERARLQVRPDSVHCLRCAAAERRPAPPRRR